MDVVCLSEVSKSRPRKIAESMSQGIAASGDRPFIQSGGFRSADVVVAYGWKRVQEYRRWPAFFYADLGYWGRERGYYRFSLNNWSPEAYVSAGHSSRRFEALGLNIKPWRKDGREIVVAGSTEKACRDHGLVYQEWERRVIQRLQGCGRPIVYRPKPNDNKATDIPGAVMDRRSISDALDTAYAWVTHHSNSAVDALLAGVPVHCETGAGATLSVPLDCISDAPLLEGREQFLFDVAWLQWNYEEMKSGECWRHLRKLLR